MIHDTNSIDIMAKRKDGGLDLFIISSGPIDAFPETQKALLDKVERYLGYIDGQEFHQEFPSVDKKRVSIIFELEGKIPELLMELCKKIMLWTEDSGIKFLVREKETI